MGATASPEDEESATAGAASIASVVADAAVVDVSCIPEEDEDEFVTILVASRSRRGFGIGKLLEDGCAASISGD
jgi:hypothetical protein